MSKQHNHILPSPDFSYDPPYPNCIAGLRPKRRGSYRLEAEDFSGKLIVHNYGHGGAGITMSWGCAQEVCDILRARSLTLGTAAAVLGAGVMGLTAATLLVELGLQVEVIAKSFTPNTTSNVAGGQWAPSAVDFEQTPAGRTQFERILRRAFAAHELRIGRGFGVVRRVNYTQQRSVSLDKAPRDVVPEPVALNHLPFAALTTRGFAYQTLIVEPPIFLQRLHSDLESAGVSFVQREFRNIAEVSGLTQDVVINCTGLGSRELCGDTNLIPVKGQLALLRAQPQLEYLFSSIGYLFPRQDSVVIGGTFEEGESDETVDRERCKRLVAVLKATFEGARLRAAAIPDWIIRDK